MWICKNCGKQNADGYEICMYCGSIAEEAAQPVYMAIDTHKSDFYRVEVFDVTSDYRIAIGNPIWNGEKL